jgi:hypothetical protein
MKFFPACLIFILVQQGIFAATAIYQNSQHNMAAGNFGVSFVNGSDIYWSNGYSPATPLVTGLANSRIIGADVTGDGHQELVYSTTTASNGTLYHYSFNSNSSVYMGGGNITDVTAGRFTNTDTRDQVIVAASGGLYRWLAGTSFAGLGGGGISSVSAVDLNPSNSVDEFMTIANGTQPWLYTPNGGGGGGFAQSTGSVRPFGFAAGDLDGDTIDESIVFGTGAVGSGYELYYGNNQSGPGWVNLGYAFTGGIGTLDNIMTGDVDGNGTDEAYVVGVDGRIYQFLAASGWSLLNATGNADIMTLIVADVDRNGRDEFFAISNANPTQLLRFDPARGLGFFAVPEPGRAMLGGMALLGLLLRRHRALPR